jgi:hypothetical protein
LHENGAHLPNISVASRCVLVAVDVLSMELARGFLFALVSTVLKLDLQRTLIKLVQKDLLYTRPAQLFIKRVKPLLQREIRRH